MIPGDRFPFLYLEFSMNWSFSVVIRMKKNVPFCMGSESSNVDDPIKEGVSSVSITWGFLGPDGA